MKPIVRTTMLVFALATAAPAVAQDPITTAKNLLASFKALGRTPVSEAASPATQPQAAGAATVQVPKGDSNLANVLLVASRPVTYDIGGFRLGMSVAEVLRLAKARGLRVDNTSVGNSSFDDTVDYEKRRLKGGYAGDLRISETGFIGLVDAQDTHWSLYFDPVPGGQSVTSIQYITPWAGRTPQNFISALTQKYGAASTGAISPNNLHAQWCGGKPGCYYPPASEPAIMYLDTPGDRVRLWLKAGGAATGAAQKLIKDRAQAALAPTAPKPSF